MAMVNYVGMMPIMKTIILLIMHDGSDIDYADDD